MRIAICDDNKEIRQILQANIIEFFRPKKGVEYSIEIFSSGDELLDSKQKFDLLFLDIEMPGQDGIAVGRKIKDDFPKTIVIVVTSFSEYLDDAMRFSVFRYLSKPIDKKRFFRNMDDALDVYMHHSAGMSIEISGGCQKVETDKIIMIEAVNRKIKMYTDDDIFEISGTINEWAKRLQQLPLFYVSHRGYIINIAKIYKVYSDKIYLCGGKYQAYLTKRKYTDLKNKFMSYVEQNR